MEVAWLVSGARSERPRINAKWGMRNARARGREEEAGIGDMGKEEV
jgi:hypothetical protein